MNKIILTISNFRLVNVFKNFLIFLPLIFFNIFSNREIFFNDLSKLIFGFIIFTIMTSICYATNEYTDRFRDRNNKLKKAKKNLNKQTVIFLNILLLLFIVFIYKFTIFFNFYLISYLFFFYLYNFFFKNLFLLDIILLVSFYNLRIFYGAEILNIPITYGFLLFFISIFIILSIFKRMIQISANNIKSNKKNIIIYSYKNYPFFKKIIFFSSLLNIFIFVFYLYEIISQNTSGAFSSTGTIYNPNIIILLLAFILYIFWLIRLIKLVFNEKINKDIYLFILKDKISQYFFLFQFVYICYSLNLLTF